MTKDYWDNVCEERYYQWTLCELTDWNLVFDSNLIIPTSYSTGIWNGFMHSLKVAHSHLTALKLCCILVFNKKLIQNLFYFSVIFSKIRKLPMSKMISLFMHVFSSTTITLTSNRKIFTKYMYVYIDVCVCMCAALPVLYSSREHKQLILSSR